MRATPESGHASAPGPISCSSILQRLGAFARRPGPGIIALREPGLLRCCGHIPHRATGMRRCGCRVADGESKRVRLRRPFRLVRAHDDGRRGSADVLHQGPGLGRPGRIDAASGVHVLHRRQCIRKRADGLARSSAGNRRNAAVDRLCRRRRCRCRGRPGAAARRGRAPSRDRPSGHQPFRGRRRPASGAACIDHMAEAAPAGACRAIGAGARRLARAARR